MSTETEVETTKLNTKFNFWLYYITGHLALSVFLGFGFLTCKMKGETKNC